MLLSGTAAWLIFISIHQITGEAITTDVKSTVAEERADKSTGGLWESDMYFLKRISNFFGGGNSDKKEVNRRSDVRQQFHPEMIPPQLYYPDNTEINGESLPLLGRPASQPFAVVRGSKRMPPGRGRKQFNQGKLKRKTASGNQRKRLENLPLRRQIPGIRRQRPFRLTTSTTPAPGFFEGLYNTIIGRGDEDEEKLEFEDNVVITLPPIGQRPLVRLPPRYPPLAYQQVYPDNPFNSFTRHVGTSFQAHNGHVSLPPQQHTVTPDQSNTVTSFVPPKHSSILFPPKDTFKDDTVQKEAVSLDQALTLTNPFQSIALSEPVIDNEFSASPKIRRRIPLRRRPAPRPQRIQVVPTKPDPKDISSVIDDFEPSPKEGSMKDDAFQPIFRASQSLDVELPETFMKPMHVASARSLSFPKPAPPPEILNFFDGGGARPLTGTEVVFERD